MTLYGCPIRLWSTIQTKSTVLTIQIPPYAMLLLEQSRLWHDVILEGSGSGLQNSVLINLHIVRIIQIRINYYIACVAENFFNFFLPEI